MTKKKNLSIFHAGRYHQTASNIPKQEKNIICFNKIYLYTARIWKNLVPSIVFGNYMFADVLKIVGVSI